MSYTSAILGEVQHPVNILSEYLSLFPKRHKVKAAILSFIDGWMMSKNKEWIKATALEVAEQYGYDERTIRSHFNQLVSQGFLLRRKANWFPCDQSYEYSVNYPKLAEMLLGFISKIWLKLKSRSQGQSLATSGLEQTFRIEAESLPDRSGKFTGSKRKVCANILDPILDPSRNHHNKTPLSPQGEIDEDAFLGEEREEQKPEQNAGEKSLEKCSAVARGGFAPDRPFKAREKGDRVRGKRNFHLEGCWGSKERFEAFREFLRNRYRNQPTGKDKREYLNTSEKLERYISVLINDLYQNPGKEEISTDWQAFLDYEKVTPVSVSSVESETLEDLSTHPWFALLQEKGRMGFIFGYQQEGTKEERRNFADRVNRVSG